LQDVALRSRFNILRRPGYQDQSSLYPPFPSRRTNKIILLREDNKMRLNIRTCIAVFFSVMLAACGGGGSGDKSAPAGNAATAVTYNMSTATVSFFQNQKQYSTTQAADPTISITATLSTLPSGTAYPVVAEDKAVFLTGSTVVVRNSSTNFTATLVPDVTLSPGIYKGTLTLMLCKDQACSAQYPLTGATLPYVITVTPQLTATIKINGVIQPQPLKATKPGFYTIRAGQTLEMDSNLPIQWNYPNNPGEPKVTPTSTTSTTWQGSVSLGTSGNSTTILGMLPDGSQNGLGLTLTVTP
jgi:hypothetical protein